MQKHNNTNFTKINSNSKKLFFKNKNQNPKIMKDL